MQDQSVSEGDSTPECQMYLPEADVYTKLGDRERDLLIAAQLGKSLLEKNEELAHENERLMQQHHEQIEVLEQDKHELRRKLEFKSREYESNVALLDTDIKRIQEDLENHKAMLVGVEREKARAVVQLTEQNHKLWSQLQRASDAEQQLSLQVQQLRKEFLQRQANSSEQLVQLEHREQEMANDDKSREKLQQKVVGMREEASQLRLQLTSASDRLHSLERCLHERDRELNRTKMELSDAHSANTRLQTRVDELTEDMSMHMSFAVNANNTSSLLSELEQSGVEYDDVIDDDFHSSTSQHQHVDDDTYSLSRKERGVGDDVIRNCAADVLVEDSTSLLIVRSYQALLSGINNCHLQLFELKQELWEAHQRVLTVCTSLRTFVHHCLAADNPQVDDSPSDEGKSTGNLISALQQLSSLVDQALQTKERNQQSSEIVQLLHDKQSKLMLEKDQAVIEKNSLQVELAKSKADLMSVNSQLLEAIQQKLEQQRELEAWQDDMEHMIQKAVNDRNAVVVARKLVGGSSSPVSTPRTSWFSFARKSPAPPQRPSHDESIRMRALSRSNSASSGRASLISSPDSPHEAEASDITTTPQRTSGLFALWLRKRQDAAKPDDSQSG